MFIEVTINHLQKELGFDDDVAEYLLDNAPDGCDEDCLYELAIETDPIIAKSVRICKESFKFKKVGLGYTTEVTQIATIYMRSLLNVKIHKINVLCIQVRGRDQFNQSLTSDKAAELTAYAMENALRALYIAYEADWNQEKFNSEFKTQLKYELLELMSDDAAPNSVSISTMTCMGNIPSNPYLVKGVFGACQDCSFWF